MQKKSAVEAKDYTFEESKDAKFKSVIAPEAEEYSEPKVEMTTEPVAITPWYKSKLFWTGFLIMLSAILPLLSTLSTRPVITVQDIIELFAGFVVIILRVWFTNGPTTQPFLKR